MLEVETKIYCKKCKDFYDEDHFNKFSYNINRGIPYTCKLNKSKGRKHDTLEKYTPFSYEYNKDLTLKRDYKIDLKTFNILLLDQNNCCKICGKDFKSLKSVHVDHCHTTKKVRGLLCISCNSCLGRIKDDINLLEKCIDYLNNPTTNKNKSLITGYPDGKIKRIPNGSLDKYWQVRRIKLYKNYGISLEDYSKLEDFQKYSCAICNKNKNNLNRGLFVDHCHTSKNVRGLLCNDCNLSIGFLNDDVNLLNSAIKYLKENVSL